MLFDLLKPGFTSLLPEEIYSAGGDLGIAIRYLFPYRKSVIENNIQLFTNYHQLPDAMVKELMEENYRHMGRLFLENLWLAGKNRTEIGKLITIQNPDSASWKILQSGKSCVVVLGHLGNWEPLIIGYREITGFPIHFITKVIKSRSVNRYMHQMRELAGTRMIPTQQARDVLYQVLNKGGIVGLAADQSAPVDSHWQHFLGKPVPVFLGPATFSLRFGIPLIFIAPIRTGAGAFQLFAEEIRTDDLHGIKGNEPRFELTSRYFQVLEKYISLFPDQYYWIHKRWKHSKKAPDYLNKIN